MLLLHKIQRYTLQFTEVTIFKFRDDYLVSLTLNLIAADIKQVSMKQIAYWFLIHC